MKTAIAIAVAALIGAGVACSNGESKEPAMDIIIGDTDCDGQITVRDAQEIIRYVLEEPTLGWNSDDCPGISAHYSIGPDDLP